MRQNERMGFVSLHFPVAKPTPWKSMSHAPVKYPTRPFRHPSTINLQVYMRKPANIIGWHITFLLMGKDTFGVDFDSIYDECHGNADGLSRLGPILVCGTYDYGIYRLQALQDMHWITWIELYSSRVTHLYVFTFDHHIFHSKPGCVPSANAITAFLLNRKPIIILTANIRHSATHILKFLSENCRSFNLVSLREQHRSFIYMWIQMWDSLLT